MLDGMLKEYTNKTQLHLKNNDLLNVSLQEGSSSSSK